MSLSEGLVFALAFAASASAPGPEIAALLGRILSHGLLSGVPLALGIVAGKLVMLALAVAGLSALVATLGPVFVALQVCGGLYLVWLGIRKWRRAGRAVAEDGFTGQVRLLRDMGLGLAMTMSNPIAVAFYMALLPGVIDVSTVTVTDFFVLAAVLSGVMVVVVLVYGLSAEIARTLLSGTSSKTWLDRIAGGMFTAAGLWIVLR